LEFGDVVENDAKIFINFDSSTFSIHNNILDDYTIRNSVKIKLKGKEKLMGKE
jgi:hypothetical protein